MVTEERRTSNEDKIRTLIETWARAVSTIRSARWRNVSRRQQLWRKNSER